VIPDVYDRTIAVMGTLVTIKVIGHGAAGAEIAHRAAAVERAFGWFREIEARCTRFDPSSELMQLTTQVGVAVPASAILFQAVQFAVAVAAETGGAFDPTVGQRIESRGFDREHRTGARIRTPIDGGAAASYRDLVVDADEGTITLLRPLILDLGAVAKGLAVDTAARELAPFENFAIDAGGDLYLGGCRSAHEPWVVGISHPREEGRVIDSIEVTDRAVCTSGDYERTSSGGEGHHILDPRTGISANTVASVTVVAPTAMLADAIATAAFVLGPREGLQLFGRVGVNGLIVSPALERYATPGMSRDYALRSETSEAGHADSAIHPDAEGPAADHSGRPDGARVVGRRPSPGRAKPR
jgi:FAD:protein FMN transferase